ncbi:hypothetical protein ACNKHR_15375 [Shigella flexneri]
MTIAVKWCWLVQVGAMPGLLTLKGLQQIQQADGGGLRPSGF